MNKVAIRDRREQVSYLLIRGKTETQIAKEINVDRRTIVRDVSFLKKASHSWLDNLAKEGFIYEYKLSLDKIRNHEQELQKLYDQTNDISQKIQIIKLLDDNSKLYLELLGETPTVHAYKQALKKTQDQKNVQTA